jgi:GT2 family glycosyltransferase
MKGTLERKRAIPRFPWVVGRRRSAQRLESDPTVPPVLILTPLKDAGREFPAYLGRLNALTYPHHAISIGFLESDSRDRTYDLVIGSLLALNQEFRRANLWKRDFGYRVPPGMHRGDERIQIERRTALAKSRNHLLMHALDDEEWVLWLDVDVFEFPTNLIEQLLATGRDIVHPHCVLDYGGPTFDTNGWRDHGKFHQDDLRSEGALVELDAVGGTVLLIRADIHRDGLVFPPFLYGLANDLVRPDRGELETEGLGIMARDMGHTPWGMPTLEVRHRRR